MFEKIKDKLLFILMFFPLLLIDRNAFSTDTYWMIKYGQIIRKDGFFDTIPMSVHKFHFIPQQWLSDVIVSFFYDLFKYPGTLLYVIITSFLCIFVFYKIINLITKNDINAKVFTFIFSLIFCLIYSEARPQMISFLCLLTLIYILEKYVRTQNFKFLLFMPFLFILQINAHATCYPFLIMICCAYLFNYKVFEGKIIIEDVYNKNNILIMLLISSACLFINPYGLEMITYILRCSSEEISEYLSFEMQALTIKNYGIIVVACFVILLILLYHFKEKIKLRYLLLLIGSFVLVSLNVRSLVYFLIGFIIFVSDYSKNVLDTKTLLEKVFGAYEIMIPALMVVAIIFRIINIDKYILNDFAYRGVEYSTNGIVESIKENTSKENIRVYNYPFIGGYLQFNGFDVYMNSGLEPFLKAQNKEKDVIDEYLSLQFGRINPEEFIKEYNFDYLILRDGDFLEDYASENLEFIYTNDDFDVYKVK